MFNFIKDIKKKKTFKSIVTTQLVENEAVLRSLRDYDQGKKTISTTNIRKHLSDLQTASQ